jgi:hypothetical protein
MDENKQTVRLELNVNFPEQLVRRHVFTAAVSLVIVAELFLLTYQILDFFLN